MFHSYKEFAWSWRQFDWEKNRKTFFDFLSSGLGINVSFFRLGQFEEVESELGSPEAGVEIGTG